MDIQSAAYLAGHWIGLGLVYGAALWLGALLLGLIVLGVTLLARGARAAAASLRAVMRAARGAGPDAASRPGPAARPKGPRQDPCPGEREIAKARWIGDPGQGGGLPLILGFRRASCLREEGRPDIDVKG